MTARATEEAVDPPAGHDGGDGDDEVNDKELCFHILFVLNPGGLVQVKRPAMFFTTKQRIHARRVV